MTGHGRAGGRWKASRTTRPCGLKSPEGPGRTGSRARAYGRHSSPPPTPTTPPARGHPAPPVRPPPSPSGTGPLPRRGGARPRAPIPPPVVEARVPARQSHLPSWRRASPRAVGGGRELTAARSPSRDVHRDRTQNRIGIRIRDRDRVPVPGRWECSTATSHGRAARRDPAGAWRPAPASRVRTRCARRGTSPPRPPARPLSPVSPRCTRLPGTATPRPRRLASRRARRHRAPRWLERRDVATGGAAVSVGSVSQVRRPGPHASVTTVDGSTAAAPLRAGARAPRARRLGAGSRRRTRLRPRMRSRTPGEERRHPGDPGAPAARRSGSQARHRARPASDDRDD